MAKPSEPNRNKSYDPKKQHISETAMTRSNWYKHVHWLNVILIVGVPVYGMVQAWWVPLQLKTLVFSVLYYFATGLGITAGRLRPLPVLCCLMLTFSQATIDCGHIPHIPPHCLSVFS
jgi:hypothetical protein